MSRPKWNFEKVLRLYESSFLELMFKAYSVHKKNFPNFEIELCTLASIKTGGCPEDCGYCSQSGHYKTFVNREKLLELNVVIAQAKAAKANGATRFCMGAAWRNPPKKDFPEVLEMIKAIKKLGLETCVTLGMLNTDQAMQLKSAGLDYYNHNLDTSPQHYKKIVTTHCYDDRLQTLNVIHEAGIHICCGGILGLGESREDRIELLLQLIHLPQIPKSIPINKLIPFKGTPLENTSAIDNFDFLRTIAVARIMMPTSNIRLSAGRNNMSDEMQTLCFIAGANSIWLGEKLLTSTNNNLHEDFKLFEKLGLQPKKSVMAC